MASAPVASKRVPITEIGFGQCRFIVDDRSFPALCCGEPTLGGSWCPQHRALVFVRVATTSNGKKSAQEPVKASQPAPEARPPAKPLPPATPVTAKSTPAARPERKPEQVAQVQKKPDAPEKGKHRAEARATKATPAADIRPPAPTKAKGEGKVSSKRDEKPAATAAKRSGRSTPAKKAASSRKPAAAKPTVTKPAAKKAPAKKTAAKQVSPAKTAGGRKSSAAKRTAPAKKTAASRKTTAPKGKVPAKKPRPAGKGGKRKKAG